MKLGVVKIRKRNGSIEDFNSDKIVNAIRKSADRVMVELTPFEEEHVINFVYNRCDKNVVEDISKVHSLVEQALDEFKPAVAKSYRDYRNYKRDFAYMLDKVYQKSQQIRYIGDRSNANTDSALVSTQRSLIYGELNSQLYKKFFLNKEEREAMSDGYIYIHDRAARLDCINCCLMDIGNVLKGGFEMGNIWYNEPKSLDVAFDVIADITMSASAMQYGGFTLPRICEVLEPYAELSYESYIKEYKEINPNGTDEDAGVYADKKVQRDFEQGFQAWEYKFNTVGSSRGDYPFISISFGNETTKFGVMGTIAALKTRMNGQGKTGYKKPVLFPKLTFLHDENLHGEGKEFEYVFDKAIECSKKAMYPDYLSLTGDGYIPSIYKKYGEVISLMGLAR